ncbi:MAG: ATP-binding protein [Bacilli bacterium]
MFKEIISITKNYAIVKIDNIINDDLLNLNVVFEEDNKKILGEIEEVNLDEVKINFLGEFHDNKFFDGIIRKPSIKANIRIINSSELAELTGYNDPNAMLLGYSPLYNNSPIKINIDDMWSNHTAIFGNTGSGKTYGVARLVQNLFTMKDFIPFNSIIFIFNNTDEYDNAFNSIDTFNFNFNYKLFSTDVSKENNILKIPLWLMSVDDYANLLDVSDYSQIMIIEKMLSYVSLFAKNDEESNRYKNHLIAKAIVSVLYSNQVSARIRDQIFSILTDCHTNELNLDVEVPGVGYTREFRKCFEIDSQGQFAERVLITEYINKFIDNDTKWNEEYVPTYFTIDDLEVALNFTLISEGLLLNEKSYSEATAMKVKLHTIANSTQRKFFEYDKFITINDFISSLILVGNNKRAQIINFVLENIDDRFAKALVKIYSRILFNFAKNLPSRGSMPMHIMLEEAHRYVQKDSDNVILGYNIFERIAKEGRKFGVVLDLITQRPTELSETVISQCSNFLIFKINHPSDLEYIEKMVPNISSDVIEKQKSLQAGTCVAFGKMMKIPMIVKMDIPNPPPHSSNANVFDKWMIQWKNN